MSEQPELTWQNIVELAQQNQMLAKQLYVVMTTPTDDIGPVLANLEPHRAYLKQLERNGILFASGPLYKDGGVLGGGMFIYAADSLDDATRYAEGDPMHTSGARTFQVLRWLLNEGTITMK